MIARLLGVALIALVAVDAFLTVLLPSARGVLSDGWMRLLFGAARSLPGSLGHRARQIAGPLSIATTITTWLVLLWVGFALLFLPAVQDLGYSSDVLFQGNRVVAALYLSGTVLTTLGLGDVAAQTDGLRLLTVVEAGAGLAVFTAALGYLPAIYTVVSELRTSAESVSDLEATTPEAAVELLREDAVLTLAEVRRDVVSARQHLLRFPVLHVFHPPPGQSVLGLVEGATMLWVVARFGISHAAHPGVRPQARSLELALRRLVDDMAHHVGHGPGSRDDAVQQVEAVRAAVAGLPSWEHDTSEPDTEALADLARTNDVLQRYAAWHRYPAPGA